MRRLLAPALVLVLVLMAACSASTSGHGSSPAPSNDPAPVIAPVHDLAGLCMKMGGDFVEETESPHELYTSDEGTCFDSRMYWFARTALRDQYLKQALQYGGNYVIGDRWVISVEDPQKAAFIAAQTGGQVRS